MHIKYLLTTQEAPLLSLRFVLSPKKIQKENIFFAKKR